MIDMQKQKMDLINLLIDSVRVPCRAAIDLHLKIDAHYVTVKKLAGVKDVRVVIAQSEDSLMQISVSLDCTAPSAAILGAISEILEQVIA